MSYNQVFNRVLSGQPGYRVNRVTLGFFFLYFFFNLTRFQSRISRVSKQREKGVSEVIKKENTHGGIFHYCFVNVST
jgi:hypothetical protein